MLLAPSGCPTEGSGCSQLHREHPFVPVHPARRSGQICRGMLSQIVTILLYTCWQTETPAEPVDSESSDAESEDHDSPSIQVKTITYVIYLVVLIFS